MRYIKGILFETIVFIAVFSILNFATQADILGIVFWSLIIAGSAFVYYCTPHKEEKR